MAEKDGCRCETCVLHERLAEALKQAAYFKAQANRWAEVVDRQKLNFAEKVQIDSFLAGVG